MVALDRSTGSEVWRTKLKGSDFVNVALDGDLVLASARGQVFCLDASSGSVRWQNELKGLGLGLVAFAGPNVAPVAETERRRRAAAAAASA